MSGLLVQNLLSQPVLYRPLNVEGLFGTLHSGVGDPSNNVNEFPSSVIHILFMNGNYTFRQLQTSQGSVEEHTGFIGSNFQPTGYHQFSISVSEIQSNEVNNPSISIVKGIYTVGQKVGRSSAFGINFKLNFFTYESDQLSTGQFDVGFISSKWFPELTFNNSVTKNGKSGLSFGFTIKNLVGWQSIQSKEDTIQVNKRGMGIILGANYHAYQNEYFTLHLTSIFDHYPSTSSNAYYFNYSSFQSLRFVGILTNDFWNIRMGLRWVNAENLIYSIGYQIQYRKHWLLGLGCQMENSNISFAISLGFEIDPYRYVY